VRFVNNQDYRLPGSLTILEPAMQVLQHLALSSGWATNAKFRERELKELDWVQPGIDNEGAGDIAFAQLEQKTVEQGRLTRPHFAGQKDKATTAAQTVE
jgi:hypothetical protein